MGTPLPDGNYLDFTPSSDDLNAPLTLNVRCRRLYIRNSGIVARDYEIIAALTEIEDEYVLSGSGINAP